MKPYTTSVLPINIEVDLSTVEFIEFIFKKDMYDKCSALLNLKYTKDELSRMTRTEYGVEGIIIDVKLTAENTGKLSSGTVYMDTRIVTVDGKVPPTEIVSLPVDKTLFEGVHSND